MWTRIVQSVYCCETTRNDFFLSGCVTNSIHSCFFFFFAIFSDCFLKIILFYNYIKYFHGFRAKSAKKVYSEKFNVYPSHITLFLPSVGCQFKKIFFTFCQKKGKYINIFPPLNNSQIIVFYVHFFLLYFSHFIPCKELTFNSIQRSFSFLCRDSTVLQWIGGHGFFNLSHADAPQVAPSAIINGAVMNCLVYVPFCISTIISLGQIFRSGIAGSRSKFICNVTLVKLLKGLLWWSSS